MNNIYQVSFIAEGKERGEYVEAANAEEAREIIESWGGKVTNVQYDASETRQLHDLIARMNAK